MESQDTESCGSLLFCHPERSEGSRRSERLDPSFATLPQDDIFDEFAALKDEPRRLAAERGSSHAEKGFRAPPSIHGSYRIKTIFFTLENPGRTSRPAFDASRQNSGPLAAVLASRSTRYSPGSFASFTRVAPSCPRTSY